MLNSFPSAPATELKASPLTVMLAQFRYPHARRLSEVNTVSRVHESLKKEFPRMLSEQRQNIAIGPAGVQAENRQSWRLTDLTQEWSVLIDSEQCTLETRSYTVWSNFRNRLEQLLDAIEALAEVDVRERIGLRYVNEINLAKDQDWDTFVNPLLLGPLKAQELRPNLGHSVAETLFVDSDGSLLLRYGVGPQNNAENSSRSFMIDIDCFDDRPSEFKAKNAMTIFDEFNDAALRVFQWGITKACYDKLLKG